MNNTVSTPQYTLDNTLTGDVPLLQDLPGWNYGSNRTVTAGVIRSFNNVLIAGDIVETVSGVVTRSPGTIRISTQAPAGSIPQTWDPTATTADVADEFELSDTSPVVEMVQQQGQMIVYTNNSIHSVGVNPTSSTAAVVSKSLRSTC